MKKIMFNDYCHLTEAVLNGFKTQTRRLIGNSAMYSYPTDSKDVVRIDMSKAPYKVGEVVAIAQSYEDVYSYYEANGKYPKSAELSRKYLGYAGWKNKMFVSPCEMPHHIKITNIRAERLQDISAEDCAKEGIKTGEFMNTRDTFYFEAGETYNAITAPTAKEAYRKLIDKTCGKGTWAKNPFVWVIYFELVD